MEYLVFYRIVLLINLNQTTRIFCLCQKDQKPELLSLRINWPRFSELFFNSNIKLTCNIKNEPMSIKEGLSIPFNMFIVNTKSKTDGNDEMFSMFS